MGANPDPSKKKASIEFYEEAASLTILFGSSVKEYKFRPIKRAQKKELVVSIFCYLLPP